jgi:AraC-like DNA-binding protein
MTRARLNRSSTEERPPATATVGPHVSVIVGEYIARPPVTSPFHKIILGRNARITTQRHSLEVVGALAIPAGIPHASNALPGETLAAVFLDAERYRLQDIERLAQAWRTFIPREDDPIQLFEDIFRVPAPRMDRRIEAALAHFEAGASVAETAGRVRLSASRFTHLFTERIGMSPRDWRQWLLMRKALLGLYTGQSATAAAFDAGFADGAHLARTCRALAGVTPSEIASCHTQFVTERRTVIDCADVRAATGPASVATTVLAALTADRR